MAARDIGDILRPVFPVAAAPDLLHHLRVNRPLEFLEFQFHLLFELSGLFGVSGINHLDVNGGKPARNPDASAGQALPSFALPELDFVHHRVEAVVVRPERVQNLPDNLEAFVVVERLFRLFSGRDEHRNDDVAVLFAGSGAHHASDALHHIDFGVPRRKEQHRVETRDIYPFGEAADIAHDAAIAVLDFAF